MRSKILLEDLHIVASAIFKTIVPVLSDHTCKRLDTNTLRNKFKEYRVRGVKGPAYSHLIDWLDRRGSYDPSTVPADERPTSEMLKRLSNEDDGILIKTSILNASGKPKKNFYQLKENWKEISPIHKRSQINKSTSEK
ncbi:MAG: hypothetical protein SGJ18_15260 [Pseudomonadota bacterium]|nr:hypothetical protein [Pseudomonadota bacterium]